MRRRAFIAAVGGAVASSLAAWAQNNEGVRRVGVLMGYAESDAEAQSWLRAFVQELERSGWSLGRNLEVHARWASADSAEMQVFAKEFIELKPEVILSQSTPGTGAVSKETRTIPIVFVTVSDPV